MKLSYLRCQILFSAEGTAWFTTKRNGEPNRANRGTQPMEQYWTSLRVTTEHCSQYTNDKRSSLPDLQAHIVHSGTTNSSNKDNYQCGTDYRTKCNLDAKSTFLTAEWQKWCSFHNTIKGQYLARTRFQDPRKYAKSGCLRVPSQGPQSFHFWMWSQIIPTKNGEHIWTWSLICCD